MSIYCICDRIEELFCIGIEVVCSQRGSPVEIILHILADLGPRHIFEEEACKWRGGFDIDFKDCLNSAVIRAVLGRIGVTSE